MDALYPPGQLQHYWKASFAKELTDEAIAAPVTHGSEVSLVTSARHIYPINGAASRVAPDATAFGSINFMSGDDQGRIKANYRAITSA